MGRPGIELAAVGQRRRHQGRQQHQRQGDGLGGQNSPPCPAHGLIVDRGPVFLNLGGRLAGRASIELERIRINESAGVAQLRRRGLR